MSITLYMFIIASLPDFINPLEFNVESAKKTAVPIYRTLAVFLVIFYLICDDEYLNKHSTKKYNYVSISDKLLRLNLLSISVFLLLVIYSHSFIFDNLVSILYLIILVFTIFVTMAIPVFLLLIPIDMYCKVKVQTLINQKAIEAPGNEISVIYIRSFWSNIKEQNREFWEYVKEVVRVFFDGFLFNKSKSF
jgi:hypothetical protein